MSHVISEQKYIRVRVLKSMTILVTNINIKWNKAYGKTIKRKGCYIIFSNTWIV